MSNGWNVVTAGGRHVAHVGADTLEQATKIATLCMDGRPDGWALVENVPSPDVIRIDCRDLLRRYIAHVGDCENTFSLGDYARRMSGQTFTDDEWALLHRLCGEYPEA